MSTPDVTGQIAAEWAERIAELRDAQGMVRCSCGRYHHPDPGNDRCGVCRREGRS